MSPDDEEDIRLLTFATEIGKGPRSTPKLCRTRNTLLHDWESNLINFPAFAVPPTSRAPMAPASCALCHNAKAILKRPKTGQQICKDCFFFVFETEVHHTITEAKLFNPGDRVAIGASGGKGA